MEREEERIGRQSHVEWRSQVFVVGWTCAGVWVPRWSEDYEIRNTDYWHCQPNPMNGPPARPPKVKQWGKCRKHKRRKLQKKTLTATTMVSLALPPTSRGVARKLFPLSWIEWPHLSDVLQAWPNLTSLPLIINPLFTPSHLFSLISLLISTVCCSIPHPQGFPSQSIPNLSVQL